MKQIIIMVITVFLCFVLYKIGFLSFLIKPLKQLTSKLKIYNEKFNELCLENKKSQKIKKRFKNFDKFDNEI